MPPPPDLQFFDNPGPNQFEQPQQDMNMPLHDPSLGMDLSSHDPIPIPDMYTHDPLDPLPMGMTDPGPPMSDAEFDRMMADYFVHQLPSALCQNCGLSGCTCRNCPTLLQNFQSGSWAQGCSRRHARATTQLPPPPPSQILHPHDDTPMEGMQSEINPTLAQGQALDDLLELIGLEHSDLRGPSQGNAEGPGGGGCCGSGGGGGGGGGGCCGG